MTDFAGLELLDREDLIAMVKRMVNGGVRRFIQGRYVGVPCFRQTSGRARAIHGAGGARTIGLETDVRDRRRRVRGKIELMSLDYLVGLCAKAGVSVEVRLAA